MEMETDWSKLPMDVLTLIFAKLGPIEILMGAGLVCHPWLEAAKLPNLLWRSLDMKHLNSSNNAVLKNEHFLRAMAKMAVDRADGRLETFAADNFVDDELLEYIAKRSPSLKSLKLANCSITNTILMDTVDSCPRLELLQLSDCFIFNLNCSLCARIRKRTFIWSARGTCIECGKRLKTNTSRDEVKEWLDSTFTF